MGKLKRFVGFLGVGCLLMSGWVPVWAATPTPTPEQLEKLRSLSPQQRQQLLQFLESEGGGGTSGLPPPSSPPVVVERKKQSKSEKAKDSAGGNGNEIEKQAKEGLDRPELAEKAEEKAVKQDLKQFGYDLFAGQPTTFAPATDIPIPSDFVIGPGDTVKLQMFGKENREYDLPVNREGSIHFPGVGPVAVAGLTFREMKELLLQRVEKQFIGVNASVTMGALRSIRIFILGDAYKPGSYTVSALTTMTNALFVSGGIKPIGSLRNIQLKRNGKLVSTLDLYDLLLKGDTSKDARLQPGDVIFIPPIGHTVGVGGEVRRPAVYEITKEKYVADIVQLAGGLLPTAYPQGTQLERVRHGKDRTLIDLDITKSSGLKKRIKNGDVIRVYSILDKMEDVVVLSGHVQREGGYQWQPGMRLTDLISSAKDLLPKADVGYVLIKREVQPSRRIKVLTADLEAAWWNKGGQADIRLRPRDAVKIFAIDEDRSQSIEAIISLLQQQARYGRPEPIVSISGHVRFPGVYPYEENMGIGKLVRAAVDVRPGADMDYSLVVREKDYGQRIEVYSVKLKDILETMEGDKPKFRLKPRDKVIVFGLNENREEQITPVLERLRRQADAEQAAQVVAVRGHVRSAGTYPLEKGMRLDDLVRAAGRMTESAYTLDAELTRFRIVDGQYRQVAHNPVNLAGVLKGDPVDNVPLQPHDLLTIKLVPAWNQSQMVEVRGEVRFPGAYPITRGEKLSHVIERAGGVTEWAYPKGAIFRRDNLIKREQAELDKLAANLEAEIASSTLQDDNLDEEEKEAIEISKSLLTQAKETRAVGRLVIDLPGILAGDKEKDVVLKDGDQLIVPTIAQEVTVLGEVFSPTSHIYDKGLSRDEYINLSGGMTHKADDDRIYVVRANGAVIAGEKSGWFGMGGQPEIQPGDTIVVPLDADRMRPLKLWTDVTQILYQLGIAAASWKTVGVF